ncbi:MAG: hypothetical protein ABWZ99_03975 [Ilumatobacteraceae bacterium]
MTPDDLLTVRRSWTEIRRRRASFVERLEAALDSIAGPATAAAVHARQLIAAADELVDVLATPSELATRARAIVAAWPPEAELPRLGVDEMAWRRAASEVSTSWSEADDLAWHHAWLLLADVLAEESLTPFDAPSGARDVPPPPPTGSV